MARILAFVTAAILILIGAVLAWPAARTFLTHDRIPGEILDAFAKPVADGVRISVLYRFPLPGTEADPQRWQLAWTQAGQQWMPAPDPVVSAERVDRALGSLLDGDRRRTVWFRPEDPQGTAFILGEADGRPGRRAQTGFALLLIGLCWAFFARRRYA
jgi:hypothetical protein